MKKKTEHTIITRILRNSGHKIFTSCCLMQIEQKQYTTNDIEWLFSLCMQRFGTRLIIIFEIREKNGAHKHCSHLKKLGAQNIHVMLSYANRTNHNNSHDNVLEKLRYHNFCLFSSWKASFFWKEDNFYKEKWRKWT